MLHFDTLHTLLPHAQLLDAVLPQTQRFFVGGCIRDLLLDIIDEPTDLDVTMSGNPEEIREQMEFDEKLFSRFRTEKFGTMSLITKNSPFRKGGGEAGGFNSDITGYQGEQIVTYEITPFRQESGYADFRHPDEIVRSNSLLEDSARRDFTINCLYRTTVGTQTSSPLEKEGLGEISPKKLTNELDLLTFLQRNGGCREMHTQTIILQDHTLIQGYMDISVGKKKDEKIRAFINKLPQVNYANHISSLDIALPATVSILLDPHKGLNDLVHRTLRCVGDPQKRFTEDALRVIRGLRIVNILNQRLPDIQHENSGFDIAKQTRKAMQSCAHLVSTLAKERLHQELVKVFQMNNPFGYVALLRELGLLKTIFPALYACIDNRQPVRYHPFDTYNHTLLTLYRIQQINANYLVKLAMLYHDVGKPDQYAFMEKAFAENPDNPDRTGYEHHAQIGSKLAQQDLSRLAFSTQEIETICRYIQRHHRPGEILDSNPDSRAKKLRELISEGGIEMTHNLLDIAIADRVGQYNPLQAPIIEELETLKILATSLYEKEGRFTLKELAITGNDLMDSFELPPGPEIGKLLDQAFQRVLENVSQRNNKKDIINYLRTLQG